MAFACSNFQMKQGEMPFSLPSYTCTNGIAKKTLSFCLGVDSKEYFSTPSEASAKRIMELVTKCLIKKQFEARIDKTNVVPNDVRI